MNKEQIIKEIQKTAKQNNDAPLGQSRFSSETGIKTSDWRGKYWARWSDALIEAGFTPNTLQIPYEEKVFLEKYIELTRKLNRFPVDSELQMQRRSDPEFPSRSVWYTRFNSKNEIIRRLATYSENRLGYEDIFQLCEDYEPNEATEIEDSGMDGQSGFVYLIKHGSRREYKIGKTFNPVRREGEITLQLPEKVKPIHYIETDDPSGIEKYWHNRFSEKRKEGEWFDLSPKDVKSFKRWRRIY